MAVRFEWDPLKADGNLRKHGIDFDEASTAFRDTLSITIRDPDHSIGERRFLLLGRSVADRLLVVSHTEERGTIRLISARRANRRERTKYEEG